jgi:cytidylate kinase
MTIIMISKGTFSGGKAVAEGVAARLNYPCISTESVFDAAEEFGVPEEKLNTALNEPPKVWQQRPGKRIAHMNFVRAALFNRADKNNLVYHGYAGHLLMPGISHVLRVRIVASVEYRVKAAMAERKLDRKKALDLIEQDDRRADRWTKTLYGIHWQDPSLYDVVLNLDGMSTPSVVDLIVHMTGLSDFKPTPASQTAFENLKLSSMVWAELCRDKVTQSSDVRVTADLGTVSISGKADSQKIVDSIPIIAGRVKGVSSVINEVGVGSDWMW